MSNSRLFCFGFLTWLALLMILSFWSIEPKPTGFERLIGNFIIGAHFGIVAVAGFGDRKPRT